MTTANPSTQLRRLTVDALRDSAPGLQEFAQRFETCSDAFEQGDDATALELLRQTLPSLGDFANFCGMVLTNAGADLTPPLRAELEEQARLFEAAINALVNQSEHGDYVAVAEVLRLDFCPLMAEYVRLFPRLADALETAA